jgi:outer membrane protein assembly factor BamB
MSERSSAGGLASSRREFLVGAVGGSTVWGGSRAVGFDPVTVTAQTRWRTNVAPEWQMQTATDRAVYVGDGRGSLVALALADGTEQWRFDTGDGAVRAVERGDDALHVLSDRTVYAVSRGNGSRHWTFEPADGHPAILHVGNAAIVGTDAGRIYRISAADGTEQWRSRVPGTPWLTIGTDSDTLFVGTTAGTVTALARDDGSRRWRFAISSEGDGYYADAPRLSPVAVSSHRVFAWSDGDRTLRALSTRDGKVAWRIQVEAGGLRFPGAVTAGTVYVPDGRTIRALDTVDGSEQWRFEADRELGQLRVVEDAVIAASVGSVHGVSPKTGREQWRYDTGRDWVTLLAGSVDGRVVVGETFGWLHALSTGGHLQWELDLDAPFHGVPMVAGNTVVAGTKAGAVYAVTDPPGSPSTAVARALDGNRRFSLAAGLVGGGLLAASYRWFRQ